MEDDFCRIDVEMASIAETKQLSYRASLQHDGDLLAAAYQEERTWVVFNGKVPSIYDCW